MFRSTLPHGERPLPAAYVSSADGFDPRSRTGSDLPASASCARAAGFDPRSRTGSDICDDFPFRVLMRVSIHAPARGATPRSQQATRPGKVSIHAPARGATSFAFLFGWRRGFRSTLPHGERRSSCGAIDARSRVSIHAPARGATAGRAIFRPVWRVSIHAPARGATPRLAISSRANYVSIHAPARGATWIELSAAWMVRVSIHAPARGATQGGQFFDQYGVFRSTLPHGEQLPAAPR